MADDSRRRVLARLHDLEQRSSELQEELRQVKAELMREGGREPAAAPGPGRDRMVKGEPAERAPRAAGMPGRLLGGRRDLIDLEFLLGGRGLLLLGVVALVVAVGFFVGYAIDRGWIGPTQRVLMGGGVGAAAVAAGERIRSAGYRTYGLWLAAGGFGAIYLSVWAAVMLYGLVPTWVAFALMVGVVGAATGLGLLRGSQALVALAAFGGYLAPLILQMETGSVLFRLAYLAVLSGAALLVAGREDWHYLAGLAVAGGALMTLPDGGANPHLFGIYLSLLMATALRVARRRVWLEAALLAVVLVWITLGIGAPRWGMEGLELAGYAGVLWLASLVGVVGMKNWMGGGLRSRLDAGDERARSDANAVEVAGLLVLAVPPFLFYLLAWIGLGDSAISASRGVVTLLLGLALGAFYLLLSRYDRAAAAHGRWSPWLGYGFLLFAPAVQWSDIGLVHAWLVEGVALTAAATVVRSSRTRAAGLISLVLAVLYYAQVMATRPETDPAFISSWALTGLAVALVFALWSRSLMLARATSAWENDARPILDLGSVALFLAWGTLEISRFFDLMAPGGLAAGDGRDLARDLSISGFWTVYAAALLGLGFALKRVPLRWAGLVMALIAAGKVFLYDLSKLSQLYRIISFVLLAVVLLALSFGYQKLRRPLGSDSD